MNNLDIKMFNRVTNDVTYFVSSITIDGVTHFEFSCDNFNETMALTNSTMKALEYFSNLSIIEFGLVVDYIDNVHNCGARFGEDVQHNDCIVWLNETIDELQSDG